MGIDFTAVIDHSLTWEELYKLPDRLNQSWVLPAQLEPWVKENVKRNRRNWVWDRDPRFSNVQEEMFEQGYVHLDGPDGFHGAVFKRGIQMVHLARWWSFIEDRDVLSGLRASMCLIASVLRAEHILYVPDSSFPPSAVDELLREGASVPEAITWLKSHVGLPLPEIDAFVGTEVKEWDQRGWFLEPNGAWQCPQMTG